MNERRWQKINQIFNEAVRLPAGQRESFVLKSCENQSDVYEEVILLLALDENPGLDLEQSAFALTTKLLNANLEEFPEELDFNSYRIIRPLGRGGMGIVFLAEDTRLGRRAAIKILSGNFNHHNYYIQRFRREARLASLLDHQNIAHIYEFGMWENHYYIVMEYVAGDSLRDLIREKQITLERALDIARQIAIALKAAYNKGIIHGDIKPENVIVMKNGQVKVLDFGLARCNPDNGNKPENREDSFLLASQPHLIRGTVPYLSPEHIRGEEINNQTDLWSLGIVLYEMIAGRRPFEGDTQRDLMASILLDDFKSPKDFNPQASARLVKIIVRLLQKSRERRYREAEEFLADLERVKKMRKTNPFQNITEK